MGAPPAMGRARVSTPGCFVHILHARTRHQVHATPFEMDDRGTQYVASPAHVDAALATRRSR